MKSSQGQHRPKMGGTLPTAFDTRYESVLSKERSLAKGVAVAVLKPDPLTVWEVTMPLIFIFNYMRLKGAREVFSRNFLFTKELALKAALDMVKGGEPREEVMSRIEETTSGILASDKKGVYSEEIRQKQMKEIDLLIDHYCRLLEGEGKDYASLVINAYRTQKDYTTFLAQLEGAEREVNLAARQTLGTETAAEMVFKMEEATDRIRTAGVEKIFRTM